MTDEEERIKKAESEVVKSTTTGYKVYLIITAFAGWALVTYEWDLFSVLIGPASKILGLNGTQTADMLTAITFGMAAFIFGIGFLIDRLGRKYFYQFNLVFTSIFTAITGLVTFIGVVPLVLTRIGAQGPAQLDQPVAATMISEEMPARWRAAIYSFVQAGYPTGVAIASAVAAILYPILGYVDVWFIAVIPLILVVIARRWTKETKRFSAVAKATKEEKASKPVTGDVELFTDVRKVRKNPYRQAFEKDVRKSTIAALLIYFGADFFGIVILFAGYILEIVDKLPVSSAGALLATVYAFGIPFFILSGFITEIKFIGRKLWGIISAVVMLVAMYFFAIAPPHYFPLLITYFIMYFFLSLNFIALINYIQEIVPTRVRGSVNALVAGLGQVASGLSIFAYGYFISAIGHIDALVVLGIIGVGIMLAGFSLGKRVIPGTSLEAIAV